MPKNGRTRSVQLEVGSGRPDKVTDDGEGVQFADTSCVQVPGRDSRDKAPGDACQNMGVYPSIFNLILTCTYDNITIYTIEHRRASMGKQTLTPICRGVLKNFCILGTIFCFHVCPLYFHLFNLCKFCPVVQYCLRISFLASNLSFAF